MYILQPLLRIREMREDRATGELTAARQALAVAEETLAARQHDLAVFEETKEERRDRVFDTIMGRPVPRDEIDLVRTAISQIDEEGVLLTDGVRRAASVVFHTIIG